MFGLLEKFIVRLHNCVYYKIFPCLIIMKRTFIDHGNTKHLWPYYSMFAFKVTCIILIFQVGREIEKNKCGSHGHWSNNLVAM